VRERENLWWLVCPYLDLATLPFEKRALDERKVPAGARPSDIHRFLCTCQFPDGAAAFFTISASIVMATSSPTTTPPPSIVAFHFTPKSCRLIFVVALTAAR